MAISHVLVASACLMGLAGAGVVRGGHGGYGDENYGPPAPYDFGYSSEDRDGSHGHSQSSDGRTVRGHYMIQLADGHMRRVEYYADETGFHANILTNELGTESKDAADAFYQSSAITGEQAALQYGNGPANSNW
ncbi:cuticle protein 16.8-like [Galendromus occidentalis]|uniref:Cuticle protein 16.8-like n=1 Tax=Galendromus occidentalis TaxID=34638 RepID=A0AAJ6QNZ6_9ACAR|nr:cuticle protein 16.8-like [Galendromus occidentalis]